MLDRCINAKEDTLFTLYLKEKDVAINLFSYELVNLIKEAVELLKLTGENHDLFESESGK